MPTPYCPTCNGPCEHPPQLWFRSDHQIYEAVCAAAYDDGRSISDYLRRIVLPELERRGVLRKGSEEDDYEYLAVQQ